MIWKMATPVCMQVFAGCYERTVFGFDLTECKSKENTPFTFKGRFTNNAHTGCIKSLAANGKCLASGSTDELINLYDLEEKVELGSLMQHDGSVTSLSFHGNDHMISGGEDGVICIWNAKTWECMKILKGHKSAVNAVAVHPSGKLALSVSKDKTLRTWNLLKGRAAYTTNIKKDAEIVLWSPDGQLYAVVTRDTLDIYDITTAAICCSHKASHSILTACFITHRVIAIAGEGEMISILRVNDKKTTISSLSEFKAHENRIKCLHCSCACGSSSTKTEKWLLSASSDGALKLWSIDIEELSSPPVLLAEVKTQARLTCLGVKAKAVEESQEKGASELSQKRQQASSADDAPVKKKKKKSKP